MSFFDVSWIFIFGRSVPRSFGDQKEKGQRRKEEKEKKKTPFLFW